MHYLNNFNVTNMAPRPESYLNDVVTAQAVPEADRAALYVPETFVWCLCSNNPNCGPLGGARSLRVRRQGGTSRRAGSLTATTSPPYRQRVSSLFCQLLGLCVWCDVVWRWQWPKHAQTSSQWTSTAFCTLTK